VILALRFSSLVYWSTERHFSESKLHLGWTRNSLRLHRSPWESLKPFQIRKKPALELLVYV